MSAERSEVGAPAPDREQALVPEADGLIVRCAQHPSVETGLRCSRCDTPICPRCLVMTPVGARCRPCARLNRLPIFVASPRHILLALAAGAAAALVGGGILRLLPSFGWLSLLLCAALGYGVGEAVSLATNRKQATVVAWIATAAAVLGGGGAFATGSLLFALVAGAVAGVVAWGRVRRM